MFCDLYRYIKFRMEVKLLFFIVMGMIVVGPILISFSHLESVEGNESLILVNSMKEQK